MAINTNDPGARVRTDAASRIGTTTDTGSEYSAQRSTGEKSQVAYLKEEAREKAGELVGRARERASSGIEETMLRAAGELGTVASALRHCSSDMSEDAMLAPYVEKIADQVDRVTGFLEKRSVDDIARDVQSFARRNPAIFLGACFGVGVLAARFLKSSRPQLPVPYDEGPYGHPLTPNNERVGYGDPTGNR